MSGEEGGGKWLCTGCTYANWPKALKCTICNTPRATDVISQAAPPPIEERDIYKMAPPLITDCSGGSTTDPDPAGIQTQQLQQTGGKWSCLVCTFLNWPRSTRCTQCRSLQGSNKKETLVLEALSSPKDSGPGPNHQQQSQAQRESEDSPASRRELVSGHNDRNRAWTRSDSLKWGCAACTYENWPKSQKCVLCHQSRPRDSLTSQPSQPSEPAPPSPPHCRLSPIGQPGPDNLIPSSPPTTPPPQSQCTATGHVRLSPTASININNNNNNNNSSPTGGMHWRDKAEIQVSCSGGSTPSPVSNNYLEERRLRQLARHGRKAREVDWLWLNACLGAVEGNPQPVLHYLSSGGDPTRQLTPGEVALLARPSAFDVGHTLVHLAIRFQHDELLSLLLSNTSVSPPVAKRVPSDISRHIAAEITRHLGSCLKQRKGDFHCYFATEFVTFALPAEIEDFPTSVQERLFDELLDRDVQKELEEESPLINWSMELTERLGSRLYALWNRSAGDCLLDSALQATWGVFDRDNTLRRALGDSLCEAAPILYPRWKEAETLQANLLHFSLDESQWQEDWAVLLSLATQPGSALEQMHIFTLAHILRRPIIVYGVKYVKSFRGEALGYARFEGIYLPLLWEPSFCWKSPIALGYTRGHFSALVSMEPDSGDPLEAGANIRQTSEDLQVVFLPLMTSDLQLLPLHFLTQAELGREEEIMREWLDCCVTEGGLLVAQQKIPKKSLLASQMLDQWLDVYRRLNPPSPPPTPHHHHHNRQQQHHRQQHHRHDSSPTSAQACCYSSDGDSDQ